MAVDRLQHRSRRLPALLVVCSGLQLLWKAQGQVSVPLKQIGFSFYADIETQSTWGSPTVYNKTAIIDTGNNMLTFLNSTEWDSRGPNNAPCLALSEDLSNVEYLGIRDSDLYALFKQCARVSVVASMGSAAGEAEASINVTHAYYFQIDNPKLHNWTSIDGDLGLSYCQSCQLTPFQTLLLNSTAGVAGTDFSSFQSAAGTSLLTSSVPIVFGLDLNLDLYGDNRNLNSSMQLGYIDQSYADSIVWHDQATDSPSYHQFIAEDVEICGANVMTKWAGNWPVIVDTGQVCVQLPTEFYKAFSGWFDLTTPVTDASELPALAFKMFVSSRPTTSNPSPESATTFYIPLENLILDADVFVDEGAPNITIGGVTKSLCLLESGQIADGQYDQSYNTPNIVLGTLALKSLYFAADFAEGSVGIASKLNASQSGIYASRNSISGSNCAPKLTCIGDQNYESYTNTCRDPSCNKFFFTQVDTATQKCYYNTAFGWGLFFVCVIASMEVLSFFAIQQTTIEFMRSHFGDQTHTDRVIPMEIEADNGGARNPALPAAAFRTDIISRLLGPFLTSIMDFLVVRILQWTSGRQEDHQHNR
jgi:hypothetical protein